MLIKFRAQQSIEHPGEIAIYADEGDSRRTVCGVVARDALADVWQTTILDSDVARRLVERQVDKFGRVLQIKYQRHAHQFEASSKVPHHFVTTLTAADFQVNGERFDKRELLNAEDDCLRRRGPVE